MNSSMKHSTAVCCNLFVEMVTFCCGGLTGSASGQIFIFGTLLECWNYIFIYTYSVY